jgi:hypothetical protein
MDFMMTPEVRTILFAQDHGINFILVSQPAPQQFCAVWQHRFVHFDPAFQWFDFGLFGSGKGWQERSKTGRAYPAKMPVTFHISKDAKVCSRPCYPTACAAKQRQTGEFCGGNEVFSG